MVDYDVVASDVDYVYVLVHLNHVLVKSTYHRKEVNNKNDVYHSELLVLQVRINGYFHLIHYDQVSHNDHLRHLVRIVCRYHYAYDPIVVDYP